MKFVVSRTSDHRADVEPPCPEAKRVKVVRVDTRNADSPEDSSRWYNEGFGHEVVDGCMRRYFHGMAWVVNIPTIKALLEFCKKHGDVIVSEPFWYEGMPQLEIYDDFLE